VIKERPKKKTEILVSGLSLARLAEKINALDSFEF
jgi:hypothetical protein